MYRNVYWHHAVRSATAMYKRLVSDALDAGSLSADQLAGFTDEGLLLGLEAKGANPLLKRLRERRLYKRAMRFPPRNCRPTPASGSPTIGVAR